MPTTGRIAYRTTYSRMGAIKAMTFVDWNVDTARGRYELWLRTSIRRDCLTCARAGTLQPFGIAPERYVERIEIANREQRAEFDWKTRDRLVRWTQSGPACRLPRGVQDPLSLQFHLPLLAQAYPWRFTEGAELSFQVARRDIETYVFKVVGYEPVRIANRMCGR